MSQTEPHQNEFNEINWRWNQKTNNKQKTKNFESKTFSFGLVSGQKTNTKAPLKWLNTLLKHVCMIHDHVTLLNILQYDYSQKTVLEVISKRSKSFPFI